MVKPRSNLSEFESLCPIYEIEFIKKYTTGSRLQRVRFKAFVREIVLCKWVLVVTELFNNGMNCC